MDNRQIRLENLRYAIRVFGGAGPLSERAGCSKKYLEQILQGFQGGDDRRPRKLGDIVARKIATALGKDPAWMDYPHPEIWGDDVQIPVTTSIAIPQYDVAGRMGNSGLELRDQPGTIKSWTVSDEWLEQNVRNHTGKKNLCIVTGFGDSMRPMFNPGDPLIIDAGVKSVDFDGVYFFRVGSEGFIKRLQRVPGKGLLAISENESYRDWLIDSSMDFEVLGRVLKTWCSEEF